jgi:hypothetical protein
MSRASGKFSPAKKFPAESTYGYFFKKFIQTTFKMAARGVFDTE